MIKGRIVMQLCRMMVVVDFLIRLILIQTTIPRTTCIPTQGWNNPKVCAINYQFSMFPSNCICLLFTFTTRSTSEYAAGTPYIKPLKRVHQRQCVRKWLPLSKELRVAVDECFIVRAVRWVCSACNMFRLV